MPKRKKIVFIRSLAKKTISIGASRSSRCNRYHHLGGDLHELPTSNSNPWIWARSSSSQGYLNHIHSLPSSSSKKIPNGFFAIYADGDQAEERFMRERFVVPTSFLSHPLFKMLLERAHNEFGFDQKTGLVVPCSASTLQEVCSMVLWEF